MLNTRAKKLTAFAVIHSNSLLFKLLISQLIFVFDISLCFKKVEYYLSVKEMPALADGGRSVLAGGGVTASTGDEGF